MFKADLVAGSPERSPQSNFNGLLKETLTEMCHYFKEMCAILNFVRV